MARLMQAQGAELMHLGPARPFCRPDIAFTSWVSSEAKDRDTDLRL